MSEMTGKIGRIRGHSLNHGLDAILVDEKGNEVRICIHGWPTITAPVDGACLERLSILEIL